MGGLGYVIGRFGVLRGGLWCFNGPYLKLESFCLFVWAEALRPSQQFFRSGHFPGLKQYFQQ